MAEGGSDGVGSNPPKGLVVVLAGPSGVGKTTVRQALLDTHADYVKSVSATTRTPRESEEHGRSYFFLSQAEFDDWIASGRFIEHAEYQGNRYGTPHSFIEEQVAAGRVVLLDIEVQGVQQLIQDGRYPLLTIFLLPPSFEVLAERLAARATENLDEVAGRIHRAQHEMRLAPMFDHQVVNEDLPQTITAVEHLIESGRAHA